MKQFLLPRWYAGQARISISGDDYHYLARVLRLQSGDKLPALDAQGARYIMTLSAMSHSGCEAEISPVPAVTTGPVSPALTLLQCLPKGKKIDQIVRQATEAGVSRIVLLEGERSVAKATEDEGRMKRLSKIAREALQQSGGLRLPSIEPPRPLASLLNAADEWGTALFFHEERISGSGTLHGLLSGKLERISILIGPEGGLSPSEVALLSAVGFHAVCLGEAVLRVETAAIYAIAAVQTILQERDAWTTANGK